MTSQFGVVRAHCQSSDRVQDLATALISQLVLPLPLICVEVETADMRPARCVTHLPVSLWQVASDKKRVKAFTGCDSLRAINIRGCIGLDGLGQALSVEA